MCPLAADYLLVGHTHLPFSKPGVLNPGSVGQPKHGAPRVSYAIWDGRAMRLESAAYDFEATVGKIDRLPLTAQVKEDLSTVLRTGSASALKPLA